MTLIVKGTGLIETGGKASLFAGNTNDYLPVKHAGKCRKCRYQR